MRRLVILALLAAVVAPVATPVPAAADPGTLDISFGVGGYISTDVNGDARPDTAHAATIDTSGRMVVAGECATPTHNEVCIVRYTSAGALDSTFSGDGMVSTDVHGDAGNDVAYGVVTDSNDRVIVAGECDPFFPRALCLLRYTAAGELDPTFGTGGVVSTGLLGGWTCYKAVDLALDASGNILVASHCYDATGGFEFGVLRYTDAGELDLSFDGDGLATVNASGNSSYDYAEVVAVDSVGRIVVAGRCTVGNIRFCTARFTTSGAVDLTFGTGGVVATDIRGDTGTDAVAAVAFDASGKILVAGSCNFNGGYHPCAARYTGSGALDTSFSNDGMWSIDLGSTDWVADATIDDSNRILLAGACRAKMCLIRLLSDGSFDTTLGADGVIATDVGGDGLSDFGVAVEVDSSGRLLVAGSCSPSRELCAVRYLAMSTVAAPSAPISPAAVPGDRSITASWSAPLGNGGAPILTYTASASPGGSSCTTSTTSCRIPWLVNGSTYDIVITANNGAANGSPTTPVSVIPAGLPDRPTSVMATPGNGSATASWSPPTSDGGSPILSYQVLVSHGISGCTTSATSCVLTGMTNGTRYSVWVRATNAMGTGSPSASTWVTPVGPSTPPQNPVATAGHASAVVAWSAPFSNGGSPITSYEVTAAPDGSTCTTTAMMCEIGGLTNGTTYTFSVTATNAHGTSPASSSSNAVVPVAPGRPGVPRAAHAEARAFSATVWWASPASDGGSPVTGYTVTASPGGASCSTSGTTNCTVTGLTNWTSYDLSVTATNAVGTGPAAPVGPVTPGFFPGPIADVSLSADGLVTWSSTPNGAPIDHFLVEYREIDTPGGWLTPAPTSSPGTLDPLIVGGSFPGIEDHRYGVKLVAFLGNDTVSCGGTLIADQWVLTAAHCTEFDYGTSVAEPDYFSISYGLNDWTDFTPATRPNHVAHGSNWYRHPGWDPKSASNDIALIRLDTPVNPTTADTIPIFELSGPAHGSDAYVTGWGDVQTGGPDTLVLKGAEVKVDSTCGSWPGADPVWDPDQYVCASGWPSGVCNGDSGGPLVVNNNGVIMVAGVISFTSAAGCAYHPDLPDVYSRVSTHADWIKSITGSLWSSSTVAASSSSTTLLLDPGVTYAVQVRAVNSFSGGEPAATSLFVPAGPIILGPRQTGVDCRLPQPHPLTDIPSTSFAYNAIGCIYNLGITTGTSATTYSPGRNVTRGEMAAFLARFYEKVTGQTCEGPHPFSDVPTTSFAHDPIGCIYSLGVTTGTSATTYAPANTVTREQMAAFIARFYRTVTEKPCAAPAQFADVPSSSFAYTDVGCIYGLGVTTGTSPTSYSPDQNVTRVQMAAFIARLYRTVTA